MSGSVRCPVCGMTTPQERGEDHLLRHVSVGPNRHAIDAVAVLLSISSTGANTIKAAGGLLRPPAPEPDLRAAAEAQLADLVGSLAPDFGTDRPEAPRPPADLTAYGPAFASAAARCRHEDATETLYAREWWCPDCHRVLGRDDMRRTGRPW